MTWLNFMKKREKKAQANAPIKVFFLKQPDTDLYVHPAGEHAFDNSAYALREGKVGAICVMEHQINGFFELFLKESNIQLATEELKAC